MTTLYQLTIYLTVTTALVLIFKRLFRHRLSARWQLYCWAIVLLRLVLPGLPQTSISVYNTIPSYLTTGYSFPIAFSTAPTNVPPPQIAFPLTNNTPAIDWLAVLFGIWACGAILLLLYFAAVYTITARKYRQLPDITDESTLQLLADCRQTVGVHTDIRLKKGEGTPLLFGFFNPVLILPNGYTEKEKRDIFLHELCHHKHKDVLIIWLGVLVLCANWFNPLIWYAFSVLRRDIEAYCDQRVLRYTESAKDYALLLLKTSVSHGRFIIGSTCLQNGESEVSHRIKTMANFKKPGIIGGIIIIVLAIIIALACLTNAEDNPMAGVANDRGEAIALEWAEALRERDGKARYELIADDHKDRYYKELVARNGEEYPWNIGVSSPWVEDFTVSQTNEGWLITYETITSEGPESIYIVQELLIITEKGVTGWYELASYLPASLYEQARDIEEQIGQGHESWRLDPIQVVRTQLPQLANAELKLLGENTGTVEATLPVADDLGSNKYITLLVQLYHPINDGPTPFWAVAEVNIGDTHYNVSHMGFGSIVIPELSGLEGGLTTALYIQTAHYLDEEFRRVYGRYYDIQALTISNWEENGNEATFFYNMSYLYYNRDPDKVKYIQEAKETNPKAYETLYNDYLLLHEANYDFKIVWDGDEPTLYSNVSPVGVEWAECTVDDFILK